MAFFRCIGGSGDTPKPKGELIYDWDFTESLIDKIGGVTATLNGTAIRDSEGLHIDGTNNCYCSLFSSAISTQNKNYNVEIDIKNMEELAPISDNRPIFLLSGMTKGFYYRTYNSNNHNWGFDGGSNWSMADSMYEGQIDLFKNNTLRINIDDRTFRVYKNDEIITPRMATNETSLPIFLGGRYNNFIMTIKAVRIYANEEV